MMDKNSSGGGNGFSNNNSSSSNSKRWIRWFLLLVCAILAVLQQQEILAVIWGGLENNKKNKRGAAITSSSNYHYDDDNIVKARLEEQIRQSMISGSPEGNQLMDALVNVVWAQLSSSSNSITNGNDSERGNASGNYNDNDNKDIISGYKNQEAQRELTQPPPCIAPGTSDKEASKQRWKFPIENYCTLPSYRNAWVPHQIHQPKELVLIYQYGKTASTAVHNYFRQKKEVTPSVHCHQWNQTYCTQPPCEVCEWGIQRYDDDQNESGGEEKPIWIITQVRQRYVRDMSSLLENHGRYQIQPRQHVHNNGTIATTGLEELRSKFYQNLQREKSRMWFTNHFLSSLGIDLVKESQLQGSPEQWLSQRHLFVRHGRYRIILLRYEDIEHWGDILHRYFPSIQNDNSIPKSNTKAGSVWDTILHGMSAHMTFNDTERQAFLQDDDTPPFYTDCENQFMNRAAAHPTVYCTATEN